ncbi:MAG: 16S rRNA (cytidine(1402)-2'-O)-methyltransferase [Candidatus Marinimicrobia bacterium]|nr:16S rRNA (cytidine(1402)-2'-O)-methyltransferase [Candidatus Neomarinimicrobiota bacterium]
MSGSLFVVATPIGNLEDISLRAINTLKEVDVIVAEDTRITGRLLKKYDIKKSLTSFHIRNEARKVDKIINYLNEGKSVALVSDAGTPCISDPGYLLVNKARNQNIEVLSIPGPSSTTAALSISGLPSEKFYFEGFLPKKKGKQKRIEYLSQLDSTVVLFESPYRLIKTLEKLLTVMGNRHISVCKEISKINEDVFFGKMEDVISDLKEKTTIKGEYVVLVAREGYSV